VPADILFSKSSSEIIPLFFKSANFQYFPKQICCRMQPVWPMPLGVCRELSFVYPFIGKACRIEAELPLDMQELIARLSA
jgi:hypothetical protein